MILQILTDVWATLCDMSPYLLFGFLAAGILSVAISKETVENHLGEKGFLSVFKASLFGVPLPLCSCSVIPVTVSLKKSGANNGAATAFLTSTPQTGVDSIFVTFSLLGPVFAIFRPIIALITGVIAGLAVNLLGNDAENPADEEISCPHCASQKVETESECHSCEHEILSSRGKIFEIFRYGFLTIPTDVAKPLMLGILIAGIISALVPNDFFASKLGTGLMPMLVMMLIGIPMYVCSTASIPIAAALIMKGISPGAAFVFLITGAATNAAGIITIWKVLGKSVAVIYVSTVIVVALLSGFLLNFIYSLFEQHGWQEPKGAWMLPAPVKIASAIALLLILGLAVYKQMRKKHNG